MNKNKNTTMSQEELSDASFGELGKKSGPEFEHVYDNNGYADLPPNYTKYIAATTTTTPPRTSVNSSSRHEDMLRNGCSRTTYLPLFIFFAISLVATAAALAMIMNDDKDEESPPSLVVYIVMNQTWKESYSDHSSRDFQQFQQEFTHKMDKLFKNSSLAGTYNHTEILEIRHGSVIVLFRVIMNAMFKELESVVSFIKELFPNSKIFQDVSTIVPKTTVPSTTVPTTTEPTTTVPTTTTTTVPTTTTTVTTTTTTVTTTVPPTTATTVPTTTTTVPTTTTTVPSTTTVPTTTTTTRVSTTTDTIESSTEDSAATSETPVTSKYRMTAVVTTEQTTSVLADSNDTTTESKSHRPPTTHINDNCYPLKVQKCLAAGYSRTMFPNFKGETAEDAIKSFNNTALPIVNSGCSHLALHYMCGLFFPKCDNGQIKFPCKSTCLAVKKSCGDNSTILGCERLTDIEQYCFLPSFESTTKQSSAVTPASTTPPHQHTTTPATTTPINDNCYPLKVQKCLAAGYSRTMFPNFKGETAEDAIKSFNNTALPIVNSGCSHLALHYMCGLFFPKCENGQLKYPCKSTCLAVQNRCGRNSTILPCEVLLDDTNYCFVSTKGLCYDLNSTSCEKAGYKYTMFPNMFGDADKKSAEMTFQSRALSLVQQQCSPLALHYTCGLIFPQCDVFGRARISCKSTCLEIEKSCGQSVLNVSCSKLVDDPQRCFSPIKPTTKRPETTTEISTQSLTTTAKPLQPDQCFEINVPQCLGLGYSMTMAPNIFNDMTLDAMIASFNKYALPSLATNCSSMVTHFWCGLVFPKCEDGKTKFSCKSTCLIVTRECGFGSTKLKCDMLVDDDRYCFYPPALACDEEFLYRCSDGKCIELYHKCDGKAQCADGGDEVNCTCPYNNFVCHNKQCIMREWVCDGESDCDDGSDEIDCIKCQADQFVCNDFNCINQTQHCNGVNDCPDGSDELLCVIIREDVLHIRAHERFYPVCHSSMDAGKAGAACKELGMKTLISFNESNPRQSNTFANIQNTSTSDSFITIFGPAILTTSCPSNTTGTKITCQPRSCGIAPLFDTTSKHASSYVAMIVGGVETEPGSVPWHAYVKIGKSTCGGSVISANFILTAAHCIRGYQTDKITVYLGVYNFDKDEPYRVKKTVRRIISQNFNWHPKNDIALLEVNTPIVFTDYIQPICLVDKEDIFSFASNCRASGFGYSSSEERVPSKIMKSAKMTYWQTKKCNSSHVWDGLIQTSICAGHYTAQIGICLGDSGGPLWCEDEFGVAKLVGVSSYVSNSCDKPGKPGVFADVQHFLPWIKRETDCKFRCQNNQCLFDENLVCDRKADCADNSDEQHCETSASCTFDGKYLCGYNMSSNWISSVSRLDTRRDLYDHIKLFPLFDHTHGGPPGHFISGYAYQYSGETFLETPVFEALEEWCVRFFYQLFGTNYLKVEVFAVHHNDSIKQLLLWTLTQKSTRDSWKMAQSGFTGYGNMTVKFLLTSSKSNGVAIDDVNIFKGSCPKSTCLAGEFSCNQNGSEGLCIVEKSRCNIATHCKTSRDETDCKESSYECDFSNGVVCGVQQPTGNQSSWLIGPGTHLDVADHTNNTKEGMFAYAPANFARPASEIRRLVIGLTVHNRQHCLTFYMKHASYAVFMVSVGSGHKQHLLWWYNRTHITSWSKVQLTLPSVGQQADLYFDVKGSAPHPATREKVMLDDISIQQGPCGKLACGPGWLSCGAGDLCYPQSKKCDRTINCRDASDEHSCKCTDQEFECDNGMCISLMESCNGVPRCTDGSDEIRLCGPLRTVTCDFEHSFQCGYRSNGTKFKWQRGKGSTTSSDTGPSSGANGSKWYMFVEATGVSAGTIAALTTPPLSVTRTASVSFSYHMYGVQIGELRLMASRLDIKSDDIIWRKSGNQFNKWHRACVRLPYSTNMTLTFLATRSKHFANDFAIDSVAVADGECGT